jgi:hypothetical protein
MMQFLKRLTAPFRSRSVGASTQRRPRRVVLGVEAFEERLAPSMNYTFTAFQTNSDVLAGQQRQIDYWSWGERQIPTDQFFQSNPNR